MQKILKELYYYLPDSIKYGYRYKQTLRLLSESVNWSQEKMQAYQTEKVKEMLQFANENVPYYTQLFKESHFSPEDFHALDDMKKIPYLTKSIVREQGEKLLSKKAKRRFLIRNSTSGSTGEPAVFLCDLRETHCLEQAFVMNAWKRIGFERNGKMAVFRGEKTITDSSANIYWRHSIPTHKTIYSIYDLSPSTVKYYYDNLIKEQTQWIHAFPSAIVSFCAMAKQQGLLPIESIKGVFLSSEIVYEHQEDIIRSFFANAKLNYLYGHTEMACFAASCSHSLNYHFQSEYGYTEFIPIDEDNYEIVATGFNNHVMPIIRYRTGDLIRKEDLCTCSCHSPYPVVKMIGGRSQNSIITKSGHKIVETAFIAAVHSSAFDKIDKMQFEQYADGTCVMRVKPQSSLSDLEQQEILKIVRERLNNDIDLEMEVVKDIPISSNGKNKLIIQHITE